MPTLGTVHGFAPHVLTGRRFVPGAVRPYVGVYSGSGALWAFEYLGGMYVSQLATKSLTGTGLTASASGQWVVLSTSPLVVAWERSSKWLVWNITANTFAGPVNIPANSSTLAQDGRSGFAYFVETDGADYYYLDRLTSAAAVEFVTVGALGDLASSLAGVGLSQLFWNGTSGYSVVTGTPPDAGFVVSNTGQSAFSADNDWLPGDPNVDWGGWNNTPGHKVPGQGFAIGLQRNNSPPDGALVKVPTPGVATVLLDSGDFGAVGPTNCDPSPDGVSAVVYSTSKIAHVSLVTPTAPAWLDIDDATPVTDKPVAFFCLD